MCIRDRCTRVRARECIKLYILNYTLVVVVPVISVLLPEFVQLFFLSFFFSSFLLVLVQSLLTRSGGAEMDLISIVTERPRPTNS